MWNRGKIAITLEDFLSGVLISDTDSEAGFLDYRFSSFIHFQLFWITFVFLKVFSEEMFFCIYISRISTSFPECILINFSLSFTFATL